MLLKVQITKDPISKESKDKLITNSQLIVFTDLDGTLLDHHSYSYEAALPAIKALRKRNITWILSTSKTFSEVIQLKVELNNPYPAIVENGSGIVFDKEYDFKTLNLDPSAKDLQAEGDYLFKTLGANLETILDKIKPLREEFSFSGFSNFSIEKISQLTGLSLEKAKLAKTRQFSEPILWEDDKGKLASFQKRISELGLLSVKGGRFIHIMAQTDKGAALEWLTSKLNSPYLTVACGDSDNDIALMKAADIAVVVRSPSHQLADAAISELKEKPIKTNSFNKSLILTKSIGPKGLSEAIIEILNSIEG